MDDKKYFYITAVISLFLYVSLILLLLVYLKNNNVKKIDAFTKTTVLQLDIILDTPKIEKEKIAIKSIVKNKKIAKKVVKKTTSTSMKQKTNLKSLFANVNTKATKVSKNKILNVKQSTISSRFKSKFEKEKKSNNLVLSDLLEKEKKDSTVKKVVMSKSENEKDPYFSKIYQMLSNRWNPTIFLDDLKAKVLVTISNNGKFSYKFIQYSSNIGFDRQLKEFLDKESFKRYPINSNNKKINIEILFQSKG
ncbi:MAG: TonB C-terminal domain-containing protein [Campylobacterota bacterium]|nr:TonB C-terminal domain-containing protein [Campylobacterota bacterium]